MPKKLVDSSYLARYFLLNAVDISDYKVFPSRSIENSPPKFCFSPPDHDDLLLPVLNKVIPAQSKKDQVGMIDQYLAHTGTTAFMVIRNDQLLFERYYNGYQHSSICTSFSTAKSFVSALIGIALHEKLIQNLDDPVTKYLPELSGSHWPAISVRHLVSMSSGLKYDGNGFFPWNDEPRVYYSLNLRQLASHASRKQAPGTSFHYNNFNLVLLGMILERVTSSSVSIYLQEKIWKPLAWSFRPHGVLTVRIAAWRKWKVD